MAVMRDIFRGSQLLLLCLVRVYELVDRCTEDFALYTVLMEHFYFFLLDEIRKQQTIHALS